MPTSSSITRDLALVYDVAYPFVAGGGQKRMFEVATRLAREGWKVTWYSLQTWDGPSTRHADGITYCGLTGDTRMYTQSGRRSIREAVSFGGAIWRARRAISQHAVVWCGQWPYFHVFALLPRCGDRMVVDWWETWGKRWLQYLGPLGMVGLMVERIAAFLFSRRAVLVAVAPAARDDLVGAGARGASVRVIPNGINCAEIEAVAPAVAGADVVYAGRLKDHKNVDHLIRALAIVRKRYNRTLSADIIGDGPERARLQALVRESGLEGQVRFHGELSTPAMLAVMKRARIFVHPSTKEGGGSITLLEANACGLPVMIYRHPNGIDPSLIRDGVTGWIVAAANPAALAAALEDKLARTDARPLAASACVEFARHHDWDIIARRYSAVLSGESGMCAVT